MAGNTLESLRDEYEQLFDTMKIRDGRLDDADGIVDRIASHQSIYEAIMQATGVPWQIVGVLHSLEGGLNLKTHLHNGDPLSARTVHVPKGRPKTGTPPFTFAESAIDALTLDGLANQPDWTLAPTLFRLEKFNGFGYRQKKINTPYLWSFSNQYAKGKFVADGKFDPNAVSQQCGAAVLLRRMIDREIFAFTGLPRALTVVIDDTEQPGVSAFLQKDVSWIAPRLLEASIPGLSVLAVKEDPFTITVAFQPPGSAPGTPPQTRDFEGRPFQGRGHVKTRPLVSDFLGLKLGFDGTANPNRLLITT